MMHLHKQIKLKECGLRRGVSHIYHNRVATRHPEVPGAANQGALDRGPEARHGAQQGQAASAPLTGREHDVHRGQQARRAHQPGLGKEALEPAHKRGALGVRPVTQLVVQDAHGPERRVAAQRGLHGRHQRGLRPGYGLVHVQADVRQPVIVAGSGNRGRRRHGHSRRRGATA